MDQCDSSAKTTMTKEVVGTGALALTMDTVREAQIKQEIGRKSNEHDAHDATCKEMEEGLKRVNPENSQ